VPDQKNPQQSVFMQGVQQPEGPFMEMLQQPAPQRQPRPHAQQGGAATAIMLGTEFLGGATQARIQQYAKTEMEKQSRRKEFTDYVTTVLAHSDLSQDAKNAILVEAQQTLGREVGKEAQGAAKKNPVFGVISKIADSMTGGPMPKGAKDLGDPRALIGQIQTKYFNGSEVRPEFSKRAQTDKVYGAFSAELAGVKPGTPLEEVESAMTPHLRAMALIDPAQAELMRGQLSRFEPRPKNYQEFLFRQFQGEGGAQPGQQPPPGAPPAPSASGGMVPTPEDTAGQVAPAPASVAAPASKQGAGDIDWTNLTQRAQMGDHFVSIGNPELVEFLDKNGKVTGYGQAIMVRSPEYTGWVDASSTHQKLDESLVRKAPAARTSTRPSPKTMSAPADMVIDGATIKKGQPVEYYLEPMVDGTMKTVYVGASRPERTRPGKAPKSPSLASEQARALSTVLKYTGEVPVPMDKPHAFYQYVLANYRKHYVNNPEVAPHFGYIDKALLAMSKEQKGGEGGEGGTWESKQAKAEREKREKEEREKAEKEKNKGKGTPAKLTSQEITDRAANLARDTASLLGLLSPNSPPAPAGTVNIPTTPLQ
jgi:hypothetical protein